ncbi:DUF2303 family protein [Sphingomonas naphthae]|uniref:DUF2303 family protein n=1 Tax=Sphingomonas naphthae TaxID=1813468 RepID=A0ABY7TMN7_9SPHN|nr:DUF2303 family protein [Sphingomonas naphthae]WCT73947.1 DUF2303 family protein [Sphingomonas naphthae]
MVDFTDPHGGVVAEARSLVEEYVKADILTAKEPGTGAEALVIRSGNDVRALSPLLFDLYREAPLHRHGTAVMLSLESLMAHVNRFKDAESVIFADDERTKPSMTAVLDYHPTGGPGTAPRFGKHRATFAFPMSDEWRAWLATDGKKMSMTDFAAFLEDRLPDLMMLIPGEDELSEDIQHLVNELGGPDIIAGPTRLMELARGLSVNEQSTVRQVVNLASGEGQVHWNATHTDDTGAPVKVPKVFMIGIPIFRHGLFWRIAARLRYRVNAGAIVFWYELFRLDRTFDAAFRGAINQVRAETDLPVFLGRPEA